MSDPVSRGKQLNPVNPITRYRNFLGLSRAELASETRLNEQGLLYLEMGCYDRVPDKLTLYFRRRSLPVEALYDDYQDFIREKRAKFRDNYGDLVNRLPDALSQMPPVEAWRRCLGITRSGLAKALCVQPAFLYKLEKAKTPSIPAQVRKALLEVGMIGDNVEELGERQSEFYYAKPKIKR